MLLSRTQARLLRYALLLSLPLTSLAQEPPKPSDLPKILTTGQPGGTIVLWGPTVGYHSDQEAFTSRVNLGLNNELLLPHIGFLNLTVEGAVGQIGGDLDGALGAHLKFPYANPGLEYSFRDERVYFKLTAIGAPRRGGILGIGDRVRLDYVPATGSIQIGLVVQEPFGTYRRNRPRSRHVYLKREKLDSPENISKELIPHEAVEQIKRSLSSIDGLMTPRLSLLDPSSHKSRRKFDKKAKEIKRILEMNGRTFSQEDSLYHEALALAFTHAAGGNHEAGAKLASEAERIMLERVIIPVNRLFGRMKKPVDFSGFVAEALTDFSAVLSRSQLHSEQRGAALEIFRTVLLEVDSVARAQKKRWKDSRLVWIPLNYGLRPEQCDSQEEMMDVMGMVVGSKFTHSNDIEYVFNDNFGSLYRDLLLSTEHYQVTVIHDFRNKAGKNFDHVAWGHVADGYIQAFINAIEEMDRGERDLLPQFFLFLDEFYYRENRSGKIVTLLEHLHDAGPVKLKDISLQERVRRQQERLQRAIDSSPSLKRLGRDYIRRYLRVQVNITHQFDPTYKEDAVMRDHRKIAFRDVFEESPESGVAILTGMGVGEHYFGPSWEDRSLVLRGPDLINLKSEARDLFLSQGFHHEEIPYFLRERPFPENYEDLCRALEDRGWTASALTTMNRTGFKKKDSSIARATLYNLMPPGALILIPDSIWSSDYWASILVAAALRGVHIYVISPGVENAPSDAPVTLELVRQALASMMRATETLGSELQEAGGSIHVGVFDVDYDVCSALDRAEAFLQSYENPHLTESGFVLDPAVRDIFTNETKSLSARHDSLVHITDFGENRRTKLHQKTQFLATREGIEILKRPEWSTFLDKYLEYHRDRCRSPLRDTQGISHHWLSATEGKWGVSLVQAFEAELASAERAKLDRVAYFVTVGSQNQDRRSMLLDGEVLVTVAGYESLITLMDFAFYMHVAHWLETSEEINDFYPKGGGVLKTIARWIKNLI